MASGGLTPIPNASVLEEIGFAFTIYPALTSMIAAKAMENALTVLKETGEGDPVVEMFNFREFCELIGFKEVWAFEEKMGQAVLGRIRRELAFSQCFMRLRYITETRC